MGISERMVIELTRDQMDFAYCSQMMTRTDPWISLKMDYDQCLNAFSGKDKEVYVAKIEDDIAGFVVLQIVGSFKGYIQTVCVGEEYRGKGLGKKLLQFSEERILKISPNLFICVSSFNTGAIRLYEEFGFKRIGELENFVKQGFSELLMRKTFGPIIC